MAVTSGCACCGPDGGGCVPEAFAAYPVCGAVMEWSYDNTACIAGHPGDCGTITGPVWDVNGCAGFPCNTDYLLTSWLIDGVDVVAAPVPFGGTGCGPDPGDLHNSWAAAMDGLDPNATWEPARKDPGCQHYVRTVDAVDDVEYGQMIVQEVSDPSRVWDLGPAADALAVEFIKVLTRECDGSVTISYLDADGQPATPPVDVVPCDVFDNGRDREPMVCQSMEMCDTGDPAAGDEPVQFVRTVCRDGAGVIISITDTEADLETPYQVRPGGEESP